MTVQSKLDSDRWRGMSFLEQMANIGSEVGRTSKWIQKGNKQLAEGAFCRSLDLIDLTLEYGRAGLESRRSMLYELCRMREYFCKAYLESDTDALAYLNKYCSYFAVAFRSQLCG